jgi:protein-disulfide isomerase
MKTKYNGEAIEEGRLILPVDPRRDHIQGPMDAPAKLVEYGDYECPYCAAAHQVVKAVQERLHDDVCFVFRQFPLSDMHPHAEKAAEAAEAAGEQGKFWEMHDILYENQESLEEGDILEYAGGIGLDVSRFLAVLREGEPARRVREDFISGIQSGVGGTPSFFINGVLYEGAYEVDSLLGALKERRADARGRHHRAH